MTFALFYDSTFSWIFIFFDLRQTLGYPSAAINTKQAGECTAQFLMSMEENNEGFKASNVHAIGFSLGAHVASFASMNLNKFMARLNRLFSTWHFCFAGNAIEKSLGVKFNRITGNEHDGSFHLKVDVNESIIHLGLDPALPFFATARHHWKLDSTDGYAAAPRHQSFMKIWILFCRNFVDVIHTNSGVYGKLETCGSVDFFMNNGQYQVNY